MQDDFRNQLDSAAQEMKAELRSRVGAEVARAAALGRYKSGTTVNVLTEECEAAFDQLVERIIGEARFFHSNTVLSIEEIISTSKEVVRAVQKEIFEISGLTSLFEALNMPELRERTRLKLDDMVTGADLKFRRLEIEFPMLEDLMNDRFRILDANGKVKIDDLEGSYSEGKIITFDTQKAIVKGDHFLRVLPNGHVEDYIVIDPNYMHGLRNIKPSYHAKVRRSDAPEGSPQQIVQHITNNISGTHTRVNIGSIDNSTNVVSHSTDQIFQDLRTASESNISDTNQLNQILDAITAMEETHGTKKFIEKYQAFIEASAAHVTVLAPFFPALTKLLS